MRSLQGFIVYLPTVPFLSPHNYNSDNNNLRIIVDLKYVTLRHKLGELGW